LQEQYNDKGGNTQFTDIFSIKIHEITLRELLLVRSLFSVNGKSEISSLVRDQPNPTIFFKVFLEMGIKNLIQYMAFDSNTIKTLLSDDN